MTDSKKSNLEDMANVEYRLVTKLGGSINPQDEVLLGKSRQTHIPRPAEIVNVRGNPFIVYEVASAVDDEGLYSWYIMVFKAGSYDLNIDNHSF